jgi:hypothetical protein
MTPTILVSALAIAVLVVAVLVRRHLSHSRTGRPADLGVVSARWISELRRDEPWSNS